MSFGVICVTFFVPCVDLVDEGILVCYTVPKALTTQMTEVNLCHVEPTAVFGGITLQRHFSALTKFAHVASRFCGRKRRGKAAFDAPINPCVRSACSRSVAVGIMDLSFISDAFCLRGIKGSKAIKIFATPFLLYSVSYLRDFPGFMGRGLRTSPMSWGDISSLHT